MMMAGIILGFLLGMAMAWCVNQAKDDSQENTNTETIFLDHLQRGSVHMIYDRGGEAWYLVRWGTETATVVPVAETAVKHDSDKKARYKWYASSQKVYNWSQFLHHFRPSALKLEIIQNTNPNHIVEELSPEEKQWLENFRSANNEVYDFDLDQLEEELKA